MNPKEIRFSHALFQDWRNHAARFPGWMLAGARLYDQKLDESINDSAPIIGKANLNDEELVRNFIEKNCRTCISVLFERYYRKVLGNCLHLLKNRHEAEDTASEVFEKVFQKLSQARPHNFAGWLYMVTRNHCMEVLRKSQKNIELSASYTTIEEVESIDDGGLMVAQMAAAENEIEKAIEALPKKQKICVYLFYFRKKRYKEIHEITGLSLNEVKSSIQNGKRKLKLLLEDWYKSEKFA